MDSGMGPGREKWIDGLKGWAILLVILGHVLSGYLDANTFPDAYYSFYPIRTWIYSFHMPLFFLISGYTFHLAYWGENGLQKKRFGKQLFNLFYLYTLFALLQWGVKQAVPELVNEGYDLRDLLGMYVEPLGNFWYLYVLFVIYALAAILQLPRWKKLWLLLPGALAIVAADAHLDWYHLTQYRILYHFFFFALGVTLEEQQKWLKEPKLAGLSALVLGYAASFYVFLRIRHWYANWRLYLAVSTCFLFLWVFFHVPRLAENRLLQRCGRHCLELYLLHTFFTAGLRSVLPLLGITTPWGSVILNFILSTGVCLGLALLAGRLPWTDVIFRPARFWGRVRAQGGDSHGKTKNSGE